MRKFIKISAYMLGFMVFLASCVKVEPIEKAGVSYSTISSDIPTTINWGEIGLAKEIVNARTKVVVVNGGDSPISMGDWEDFKPRFPWIKNMGRNLVFDSTYFYRSPGVSVNCSECFTEIDYKDYTWVELAEVVGVAYVPEKTNIRQPEEGHLAIKTIQKCQIIKYNAGTTIYKLTDNQGNYYVMHATESGTPTLDVVLPEGWSMETEELTVPLIITPFGGGDFCYYNIVGDHLGQGYHQYIYADAVYPNE